MLRYGPCMFLLGFNGLKWLLGPIESCKCIKVPTLCIKSFVGRYPEVLTEGINGLSHNMSFGEAAGTPHVSPCMPYVLT